MSKRAEDAAHAAYPINSTSKKNRAVQVGRIIAFRNGYEQAQKDITSLIESRIGEILGDAQPAPVLRAELQEMFNKIKEQ